jgi:hypothetical protein
MVDGCRSKQPPVCLKAAAATRLVSNTEVGKILSLPTKVLAVYFHYRHTYFFFFLKIIILGHGDPVFYKADRLLQQTHLPQFWGSSGG